MICNHRFIKLKYFIVGFETLKTLLLLFNRGKAKIEMNVSVTSSMFIGSVY